MTDEEKRAIVHQRKFLAWPRPINHEAALERFIERHGYEPELIFDYQDMTWAGPTHERH